MLMAVLMGGGNNVGGGVMKIMSPLADTHNGNR